jgi:hypothetical protein
MDEKFEKWLALWDKAQKDNILKDQPKKEPAPVEQHGSFSALHRPNNSVLRDCDAQYWLTVHKLNKGGYVDPLEQIEHSQEVQGDEPVTISEDVPVDKLFKSADMTKPDNKSVSSITDELGGLANPVHASTRDADNRSRATPDWAGGDNII